MSSSKKLERRRVIRKHSEEYAYFCGYCSVGSDNFDVLINHVIGYHGEYVIKIRKRTINEKTHASEHHFKQWNIRPREESDKGFRVKINSDNEQIHLVKE